jgi:MFS family permease
LRTRSSPQDDIRVRNDPPLLTSDSPPRNPDAPPRPVDDPPPGRGKPGPVKEPPPPPEDEPSDIDEPPGEGPGKIDDPQNPEHPVQLEARTEAVRTPAATIVQTDIPARLDRLPWSRFHTLVIVALGVTWILDGLEVTLAGTLAGALKESPVLRFSNSDVGFVTSAYLLGAVLGAVFFGWLTDRLGRKKLFFITLAVYLTATGATAFSWDVWSFALFRFLTGAGIGGEYTAINSTIQELVPARVRGWTDLVINGTFWIGAAAGAAGSIIVLDPAVLHPEYGWRLAFLIGAAIGLVIFFMRMWIPESPRWLMTHGRVAEAEAIVASIEQRVYGEQRPPSRDGLSTVRLRMRHSTPLSEVAATLFKVYRTRSLIGLSLMASQAFFYNAVFFTYALILIEFYAIPAESVGWYVLPFAAGNFLGPLMLGRLFDTLGRRPMIAFTYAISGLLLAAVGYLFKQDLISVQTQTMAWTLVFFFASAAASAAYLTVSETFPLEIRALTIALFYAIGTGIGGVAGPWLFGALIDSGSRASVFLGYLAGSSLMIAAAGAQWRWGVAAEGKPLETVARPLAAAD